VPLTCTGSAATCLPAGWKYRRRNSAAAGGNVHDYDRDRPDREPVNTAEVLVGGIIDLIWITGLLLKPSVDLAFDQAV
jgi:hypothetical protein